MAGAFLQLYREEAYYLERTCHYVARVGLDFVKKQVVDSADSRERLHQRLLDALKDYEDPWAKAAAEPATRREYEKLEALA